MRSKGEGTFFYSASEGRWIGRFGTITVKRKDRADALDAWERAKEKHALGGRSATAPTVGELWTDLVELKRKERASNATVDWYEAIGRKHIGDLANRRADQLTVRMIEEWADKRRGSVGHSYLRKLVNGLAQALDIALRRREITWNPARMVPLPHSSEADARDQSKVLTQDEVEALLLAIRGDRLEAWLHLIINTGMRPHETYEAKWDDVDLDGLRVTARPRKAKAKKPRLIQISPGVRTRLAAHRARQAEERLYMGPAWPAEYDGLVFRSQAGTPLDGHNMNRKLRQWLAVAGIDKKLTVYDLRRTVASLAADRGVLLVTLADFLGNDPRTLETYYRQPVAPVRSIGMDLTAAVSAIEKGT